MSGREIADDVFSMDAVPALRSGISLDRASFRPDELVVLALINGKRRIGELVHDSGMAPSVVLRLLKSLFERELIVPAGNVRARMTTALYAPLRDLPPRDPTLRGAAGAWLPPPVRRAAEGDGTSSRAQTAAASPPSASTHTANPGPSGATTALAVPVPRNVRVPTPVASLPLARGAPATDEQELWFAATRQDWFTLALIPASSDGSALAVGHALVQAGGFYRGKAIELLCTEGVDLKATTPTDWVWNPRGRAAFVPAIGTGRRLPGEQFDRVIVLDPVTSKPQVLPIAQSADRVLVVVEQGVTTVEELKLTVEAVGREHVMGCVLAPSSPGP
jgi:hypothetical protein